MKKKKMLFKKRHQSEEMSLQITSMADIFTILLVFLLKSFSSGAMNITPTQGLLLPQAQAAESGIQALKIEVSEKVIQIEGKPVTQLKDFRFDPSDLQPNTSSKALGSALEKERQRELLIAKANSDVKVDARVIVIADQRVPYETLKSVLASAALHGYTDFKLAVAKGE